MKSGKKIVLAGAFALAGGLVMASTLYVDAGQGQDAPDYGYEAAKPVKSIQRAIDMAANGDTILVAQGTYAPINASSLTDLTIRATGARDKTIIDGNYEARCVTFEYNSNLVLDGFTVTQGYADSDVYGGYNCDGGGVYGGIVKNCSVKLCDADGDGGGVARSLVVNSTISSNRSGGDGGGIDYCDSVSGCKIFNNTAYGDGGGVHDSNLSDCVISNNTSAYLGGGIEQYGGYVVKDCIICCNSAFAGGGAFTYGGTYYNCDIYGNTAWAESSYHSNGMSYSMTCGGGGVSGSNWDGGRSYAVFHDCDIHDNTAVRGGGVMFERLYNCRVYNNSATFGGGGYSTWAFNTLVFGNSAETNGGGLLGGGLYNCTVTGNTAGRDGGGVYTAEAERWDDRFSVAAYNSIVYGNSVTSGNDSADGFLGYWYNSCVGYLHDDLDTVKKSIIFRDPKFVDAAKNDYRLASGSPCIDAGNNEHVQTESDFTGLARVANETVDIGAYEYGAKTLTYTLTFSTDWVDGATGATLSETTREIERGTPIGSWPSVTFEKEIFYDDWDDATYKRVVDGWYEHYYDDKVDPSAVVGSDTTFYLKIDLQKLSDGDTTSSGGNSGGSGSGGGSGGSSSSGGSSGGGGSSSSGGSSGGGGTVAAPCVYTSVSDVIFAKAALVYDGYIYSSNGSVVGTVLVKVSKAKAGAKTAKAKVTVVSLKGKSTISGAIDLVTGRMTGKANDGGAVTLNFGVNALSGNIGGNLVDGARSVFVSAEATEKATAAATLKSLQSRPIGVAWQESGLWGVMSASIGAKGKVKVQGFLPDGTKVGATAKLIAGSDWFAIPVVNTRKRALSFVVWLPKNGGAAQVTGLNGAIAGKSNPGANLTFQLQGTPEVKDGEVLKDFLQKVTFAGGTRWKLPKAGSVKVNRKTGEVADAKNSSNPAALKLSYAAKTGLFKGTFKLYALQNGRLKKFSAKVNGIMAGAKGFGTAVIKGIGSFPVDIQ